MKEDFFEMIGNKLHYIVYCHTCSKKYEDITDYFMSANWECDSKRCTKLKEKDYYHIDGGLIDIHPMYFFGTDGKDKIIK